MRRENLDVSMRVGGAATRLSRWHPYPAMVADELALSMAAATVRPGARVLDPFCGSGRLLMAAAAVGGEAHGFDVNPLACLITRAKAAHADSDVIEELAREADAAARALPRSEPLRLRGAKVDWFSPQVAAELSQIVAWLSSLALGGPESLVAAVALSAATRDAAWIRKSGWKLHRMDETRRATHTISAWRAFSLRLRHYANHAELNPLSGSVTALLGPLSVAHQTRAAYDVVLTSPPYGDSKTTVQYGAASGLLLDVVSRIPGLEDYYKPGRQIDAECLGSGRSKRSTENLRQFWAGAARSEGATRTSRFLMEFADVCHITAAALAPGGVAMMVVGRRSVGGYRVRLDEFASATMEELGFVTTAIEHRRLIDKSLPPTINRFARSKSLELRERGRTKTMDSEVILRFERLQETWPTPR